MCKLLMRKPPAAAQPPQRGGYYFNTLRENAAKSIDSLRAKAEEIEKSGAGSKTALALSRMKIELEKLREGIPEAQSSKAYNALFYISMRLGEIERELSAMEFSGFKAD